jgi:predicted nucleic acid-binding protein
VTGPFVLDASMTLAWHFRDEATPLTRAVSAMSDEITVVVPSHWLGEVANGILVGERNGRTKQEDAARFAGRLGLLEVEVDAVPADDLLHRLLPLARAHRLTIYDTFYLELAERRGLPLASLDRQLNRAASSVGVQLVGAP